MWICIRSTRPPYQATARASCTSPSSADGVQILSAISTWPRWPSSASASSLSASPYIGEVSNKAMPAAIAAPVSSRWRPAAAAASSRRQVPSPTTGTLTRPRPRFRFSMSATPRSVRSPQSLMPSMIRDQPRSRAASPQNTSADARPMIVSRHLTPPAEPLAPGPATALLRPAERRRHRARRCTAPRHGGTGSSDGQQLMAAGVCACPAAIASAAVAWMVSASFRAWPDESGPELKAAGATAIRATAHLGRVRLTQIG